VLTSYQGNIFFKDFPWRREASQGLEAVPISLNFCSTTLCSLLLNAFTVPAKIRMCPISCFVREHILQGCSPTFAACKHYSLPRSSQTLYRWFGCDGPQIPHDPTRFTHHTH
jgi:hypothetical protein